MSFKPENPIEELQAKALKQKGIDPEEWTFERQWQNWGWVFGPENREDIRRYWEEGPSRLELVEAVATYRFAADGIRRAADAEGSALLRFTIATDPSGQTRHDTFWWSEEGGEHIDHVLWVNLSFWNLLKIITHQITWALVRPAGGSLMELNNALGQFDDPTELAVRLCRDRRPIAGDHADRARWQHTVLWFGESYPPFAQFPPESSGLEEACSMLLMAGLAWATGHEYGHALVRSTGGDERGVAAERAADRWGIIAVRRGLEVVDDPETAFRTSWPGAVVVLATVAAILIRQAHVTGTDELDDERLRSAYGRITGCVTALIQEVARHWQICEVIAIAKCSAVLVSAVIQWLLWDWGMEDLRDAGIGRLFMDILINGENGAGATINSLPFKIPCTNQHGPAGPTFDLRWNPSTVRRGGDQPFRIL